jgi:phosphatidylethanolamine/phosphatidyl-N-methylethanolamine N-methyltransferase
VNLNPLKNAIKLLSYNTFIPVFYEPLMFLIRKERHRALNLLDFRPGDRLIIPGIGMGHDLPYIPSSVNVDGIDLSDVMLSAASLRVKGLRLDNVDLQVMDAESLRYPEGTFDKAVLILFLSVVFDPRRVFSEVARVLKPGGTILVFDHFIKAGAVPEGVLRAVDLLMKPIFTSVVRVFEEITKDQGVSVEREIMSRVPGFKIYLVRKGQEFSRRR